MKGRDACEGEGSMGKMQILLSIIRKYVENCYWSSFALHTIHSYMNVITTAAETCSSLAAIGNYTYFALQYIEFSYCG